MADSIRFSVVIPLYNKRNHIARSIDSALHQDHEAFELLVVDDGSTDGSDCEVAKFSDSRIRLIRQSNAGVSAARNAGVTISSYTHIAFLDADDEWLPGFLTQISQLIAKYPAALAYATNYYKSSPDTGWSTARPECREGGGRNCLLTNYFECAATGSTPLHSSAVCIPKHTFQQVGAFPEGVALYEDLHMWTRLALHGDIAYCSTPGAIYHRDAENRACNYIVPRRSDLEFGELIVSALDSGALDSSEGYYARMFIAKYGLLNAFKATIAGKRLEARRILRTADPVNIRQALRKYLIHGLTMMPHTAALYFWHLGKALKALQAKLHGSQAAIP